MRRIFVILASLLLAGGGLGTAVSCRTSSQVAAGVSFFVEAIPGGPIQDAGRTFIQSPSILEDSDHFVWGGSVVKGDDGRYHMFYSLFDAGPDLPPFQDAWLLSSKIAHAVSDRADGGFLFQKVILRGAAEEGLPEAWDAQSVHNPHIRRFEGAYYLYYSGSRDPGPQPEGSPGERLRKRDRIQQMQQIGVIACQNLEDLVAGNFERPTAPLLSPRTRAKAGNVIDPSPPGTQAGPDNLIVVNPSVVRRPSDGKYLLYFKGNFYDPNWRGVHGVAIGEAPTGPFQALDIFVFEVRTPEGKIASAEDPFVWHDPRANTFYAVLKDFTGRLTGGEPGLALMMSPDGIQWSFPVRPLFAPKRIVFKDGTVLPVAHLERPQILLDEYGDPEVFYAACSIEPVGGKTDGSTFNVQMKVRTR